MLVIKNQKDLKYQLCIDLWDLFSNKAIDIRFLHDDLKITITSMLKDGNKTINKI